MTDKKSRDGNVTLRKAHANDNSSGVTYTDTDRGDQLNDARNVTKRQDAGLTLSFRDWPDSLPVLSEELDLIEAYLPDIIRRMIANDNEFEERENE